MKKILHNSITNIPDTPLHDSIFSFDILNWKPHSQDSQIEIIFLSELLEKRKNLEMLEKAESKPASYWNVYSPKDELEIFTQLFNDALENNKKIHIVWVTLKEELEILEKYYHELWFFNTDINCFTCNFSKALVTVSCKIENIMWRGSDYKRMWKEIFFNPPVRESGQVKALFKWINRGVIAGLYISNDTKPTATTESVLNKDCEHAVPTGIQEFLSQQILEENILPLTLARVLKYNLEHIWIQWDNTEMQVHY